MQYGASSLIWTAPFHTADVSLIGHVRSLGFEILEIPVWEKDPFDVKLVADAFRRFDVVPSVAVHQVPERDLTDPDPAVRARGIAHLRYCVDVAAAIGAPRIVGPLGAAAHAGFRVRSADQMQHDIEQCGAALRAVAPYAAERGVTLVYEPLNRYEISLGSRVEEVARIVDAVDHPSVRLLIDTFHANIEETSLTAAVRAAGPRLAYVHAIDSHRGTPGTGHLEWAELRTALAATGYDGPIVIEAMPYHVEWLALAGRVWHPPARSPDDLAAPGLRFLRQLFEADAPAGTP